jgi:hypothetical protein
VAYSYLDGVFTFKINDELKKKKKKTLALQKKQAKEE